MKKTVLTIVTLLLFAVNIFAQNTYSNSQHGLSIDFPEGWKKQPAWSNNEIQKATKYTGEVVTQFAVAVYPTSKEQMQAVNGDGPSKAWDSQKANFGQDAQTLEETGVSTIAGISMKWALTSFDNFGKKSFTKTYYFGRNDKIYRFTLMCNGGSTIFDEHLPSFEAAIKTVKVN